MIGFINIDKQSGMTAHDVVAKVRRITGIKQVGHAGTLDPMATGVLPVAIGKACRLLRFVASGKTYLAEILLGTATTTDDIEGEIVCTSIKIPNEATIRSALTRYQGDIEQMPPLYSAVHHNGKRLYAMARAGEIPENVAPRKVTINSLEILDIAPPTVRLRLNCSAGTYIRSIARDLGNALGCGGCLNSLRREQAGPFLLSKSIELAVLSRLSQSGHISQALMSPMDVIGLPEIEISESQSGLLIQGQSLTQANELLLKTSMLPEDFILATCNGCLIAVCKLDAQGKLKPEVVIANSQ